MTKAEKKKGGQEAAPEARGPIASREEILAYFTGVLRDEEAGSAERTRAAEMLAKHLPQETKAGDGTLVIRVEAPAEGWMR